MGSLENLVGDGKAERAALLVKLEGLEVYRVAVMKPESELSGKVTELMAVMTKFENRHGETSHIPVKRKRVPLYLDAMPTPDNEFQRFELYIADDVVELR